MSEEHSKQRRNAGLGVSPGAMLRTGECLFSWASWVGFLWGLASLSVMLPSPPPLSSGRPCPLQGALMLTQHFQCVWSRPLVAADPFHGRGLGGWRNSLRRGARCHAALGTCSQGPRARPAVPRPASLPRGSGSRENRWAAWVSPAPRPAAARTPGEATGP